MHIMGQEKYISINQIRDYISDNLYRHVYELEKLSPPPGPPPIQSSPSLDSKLTSKGKLEKNTKCSKGQRDVDSSISSGNNGL